MAKIKTKKGFTLIEAIVSMSLLMTISAFMFSAAYNCLRLKSYNEKYYKYACIMETIQNDFLYNYSKEDLDGVFSSDQIYISSDKLDIDTIKNSTLNSIVSSSSTSEMPYVKIVKKDPEYEVELHFINFNREYLIKDVFKAE